MSRAVAHGLRWVPPACFVGLAVAVLAAGSCHAVVRDGRSPTFLVIDRLAAAPGAEPDQIGNVLRSDVQTFGGVFEDPGQVSMRLGFRDPGSSTVAPSPTSANWITVTRYRVVFTRADGRNTPGVDVPYPFDGAATFTVRDAAVTASFTLVRAQAKLEPPLAVLRTNPVVISTIADVTFFGSDQTGSQVSVTGRIGVNFANWADPQQ